MPACRCSSSWEKKIHLTPAGVEMLHACRVIIAQFQQVEDTMTQFKGVSGGTLNVAVISAGDYFFPRLLVRFAGLHPGVTLNFNVVNREQLLQQLADNVHRPGGDGAAASRSWTR
jgi:DNA-binding transcriptional LysR family regulator